MQGNAAGRHIIMDYGWPQQLLSGRFLGPNSEAHPGVIVLYPAGSKVGNQPAATYLYGGFDLASGAAHLTLAASLWLTVCPKGVVQKAWPEWAGNERAGSEARQDE
jgi:hypothetical protein